MKNKNFPFLDRDKQVTPLEGETPPGKAFHKAHWYAKEERKKFIEAEQKVQTKTKSNA